MLTFLNILSATAAFLFFCWQPTNVREDVTRAYENHHNTAELYLNDFQSLRLLYITTDSFERIRIWKISYFNFDKFTVTTIHDK